MPMQTSYDLAPAVAVEGALACRMVDAEIDSKYNGEASAKIKFGRGVKWGSATDGKSVKLPAAETDKLCGFTVRTHSIDPGERGELDDDDTDDTTGGVKSGGQLNVLRKGALWVKVRTGCAPGDKLWVRAVAGAGEWLGAAENADDSTDMIDATDKGEFQTFAAANGLAKLRVNFG